MEGLLRDIPSTVVYIDDILVTGETDLQNIDKVLTRLGEENLTLKKGKCQFLLDKVEYLGHSISANGLEPTERPRSEPSESASECTTVALISRNGYGKFIKDISSNLAPLYRLLQKKTQWKWGIQERKAFEKSL